MNRSITLCIAVLALVSTVASAQTNGPVGAGAVQCSEYLSSRAASAERDIYAQWASGLIVGWLSSAHHYVPERLTVDQIADRLAAQCSKNRSQTLVVAALSVARDYQGGK